MNEREARESLQMTQTGSSVQGAATTTVADKPMEKIVGEPYRGKPDVQLDEGAEEKSCGLD